MYLFGDTGSRSRKSCFRSNSPSAEFAGSSAESGRGMLSDVRGGKVELPGVLRLGEIDTSFSRRGPYGPAVWLSSN